MSVRIERPPTDRRFASMLGIFSRRHGSNAQRKRCLDAITGPEQHGKEASRSGAFRDDIGDANCRDIREPFQWQQEPVSVWHTGERAVALGCHPLFALGIDGGRRDYAVTSAERSRQRLITGFRSRIDKQ